MHNNTIIALFIMHTKQVTIWLPVRRLFLEFPNIPWLDPSDLLQPPTLHPPLSTCMSLHNLVGWPSEPRDPAFTANECNGKVNYVLPSTIKSYPSIIPMHVDIVTFVGSLLTRVRSGRAVGT